MLIKNKNFGLFHQHIAESAYQHITLIVTFLALCTTNLFNCYAIQLMIFYIIMEFFVNAVKLIARAVCLIVKIYFAFTVAINTPTHAQF